MPNKAKRTSTVRTRGEARKRRREKIAVGVVQGKSATQIAQEMGVSREHASRELNLPETRALIQSWMEPHHAAIKRMIPRALAAVDLGLDPAREIRDRLTAVKTLGNVMDGAEGKRSDDSDGTPRRFRGTLEDLFARYREVTRASRRAE